MNQPACRFACGLLLLLLAGGCRTAGPVLDQLPGETGERTAAPSFGEFLPSPSELFAREAGERNVSLSETSCIVHGGDYSGSLPSQNVLPGADSSVELHSSWSEGISTAPSNLAYCIYSYYIYGFDRSAELHYRWLVQPPTYDSVWFGLSNWQTDCWDWAVCTESGVSSLGDATPYFNEDHYVYAVVVCANSGTNVLRYLRIGEQPAASFEIDVLPKYACPPAYFNINASGSTLPVGTIENYAWDLDNNGLFEKDMGPNPQACDEFTEAGAQTITCRITSSYGEYFTGDATVNLVAPWAQSWGTATKQDIYGIAQDVHEFCYCAGRIETNPDEYDGLLIKYNLAGELQWAVSWGGAEDDWYYDVCCYDDYVYTVGKTASYGAGSNDVLLQCWDPDGNVTWTRVMGTSGAEIGFGLTNINQALFVAGYTGSLGMLDVLLVKVYNDNTFQWARTWGGAGIDVATALDEGYDPDAETQHSLHITGHTYSANPGYKDVFYLETDNDGVVTDERVWHADAGDELAAEVITVSGYDILREIYIAGSIGELNTRCALLLEFNPDSGSFVQSWSYYDDSVAHGVYTVNLTTRVTGRSWNPGVESGGFALEFDNNTHGLLNSAIWADGYSSTGFFAQTWMPGASFLASGLCQSAAAGSWSAASGTLGSPGGSWSTFSGMASDITLSFAAPTTAAQLLTTGVENTGGGGDDALVTVVDFP